MFHRSERFVTIEQDKYMANAIKNIIYLQLVQLASMLATGNNGNSVVQYYEYMYKLNNDSAEFQYCLPL